MTQLIHVPYEKIVAHPDNLRGDIAWDDELKSLARSIESEGLKQSLNGKYNDDGEFMLTAGHRRIIAIGSLGPGPRKKLFPDGIPTMVDGAADGAGEILTMLAENLHRQDLDVIAEGEGYRQLKEDWGLSLKIIAGRHGKSSAHVSRRISVASMPEYYHRFVRHERITVPLERWVEFAKWLPKLPAEVVDHLIGKESDNQYYSESFNAWERKLSSELSDEYDWEHFGQLPDRVIDAIMNAKLAELKRKAQAAIDKAGWTKPVFWQHNELWEGTPDGKRYELLEPVELGTLASVRGAALKVGLDTGKMVFEIRPVKFSKIKTNEPVDNSHLTEEQKQRIEDQDKLIAAASARGELICAAIGAASEKDLMTYMLTQQIPTIVNEDRLAKIFGLDPESEGLKAQVKNRIKAGKRIDLIRVLVLDRFHSADFRQPYRVSWGSVAEKNRAVEQGRWSESTLDFVRGMLGDSQLDDPVKEILDSWMVEYTEDVPMEPEVELESLDPSNEVVPEDEAA